MRIVALVTAWISLAGQAVGQTTVAEYATLRKTQRLADYILGIGNGFVWANRQMIVAHEEPLYCQPHGVSLNAQNYLELIDAVIALTAETAEPAATIESVLLAALRQKFPCKVQASVAATPALTIESAKLRRLDQRFNACSGILEIAPPTFSWRDVNACWAGPDITSSIEHLEWVNYRISRFATDVYFKLNGRDPLAFHFRNTEPQKLYRYLAQHSRVSQSCVATTLNEGVTKETIVSCEEWSR